MYIIRTPSPPLPPPPLLASWPPFPGGGAFGNNGTSGDGPAGDLPSNWSSLIGIVTAIVGNVLIALALNVQRYAHIRLHREQQRNRERARQSLKDAANNNGSASKNNRQGVGSSRNGNGGGYGAVEGSGSGNEGRYDGGDGHEADDEGDADNDGRHAHESDPLTTGYRRGNSPYSDNSEGRKSSSSDSDPDSPRSTSYLQSPYWWLGQVLITIGEMGNFLAYGFAPASIVSPLGVVALISNCVIAPILFKESFRKRDFGGVIIAIAGAVTVVLSAKQEETKLNPHDVWDAITTTAFEIYVGVTCGLIALLMWASPRYGNRTILIDLGLVGLFGELSSLSSSYLLSLPFQLI